MKRRRGNKKGKAKKPKIVSTNEVTSTAASLNTDDNNNNNSSADESDNNNEEVDSGMDAETEPTPPQPEPTPPQPEPTIQPEKPVNTDSIGRPMNSTFGKAVYTRVKVKIKTSKNLDSQRASSDAPSQSDTDNKNNRSNQQVSSEKLAITNEKTEDSANSLSETNMTQKSVGIKIKSRGLGSSSMSPCNKTELVKGDRLEKKDNDLVHQESIYNEQELKIALEVIKKTMQNDSAGPFNAPVNPVALGIPDYFEVITTPMDFGTICSNLEKGGKYKNSEDVFKDVQYIWDNCYKYNNKGDYIVELMRKVKKAFMKHWTAVGLFNDQPQENNGSEGNPVKETTPSSDGNTTPVDGSALNFSSKKFHGLKKHKEGCQCAICVMMRRRQEREEIARLMGGQTDGSDDSMGDDVNKPEGIFRGNSPFGEYASSNMENSPDADANSERKGQEMKLGHIRNFYSQHEDIGKREGSQDFQFSHRSRDDSGPSTQIGIVWGEIRKEMPNQNDDATDQQRPKASLNKKQRAKMLENLSYLENPMLLNLYGTLFADNSQSFWNGPHSLIGRNQDSKRQSSFCSAISSLMK